MQGCRHLWRAPLPPASAKALPPGSPGWHSFPWPALWLPWASCEVDALPTPCGRHPGTASPIFYGKGTQEMNTLAPNCGCRGTGRACGERVWSGHPTRSLTLMPQPGQPCTVAKPPPAGHGPSQPGTAPPPQQHPPLRVSSLGGPGQAWARSMPPSLLPDTR